MSWPVFVLIPIALIAFVSGQLFLKRAMESSRFKGFRDAKVITFLGCGIFSMTIHFFVTLGLLGHLRRQRSIRLILRDTALFLMRWTIPPTWLSTS